MVVLVAAVRAGDYSVSLANDPLGNRWLAIAMAFAFLSATAPTAGSTAATSPGAAAGPTAASPTASARATAASSTETAGGHTTVWICGGESPPRLYRGAANPPGFQTLPAAQGETEVRGAGPPVPGPLRWPPARGRRLCAPAVALHATEG